MESVLSPEHDTTVLGQALKYPFSCFYPSVKVAISSESPLGLPWSPQEEPDLLPCLVPCGRVWGGLHSWTPCSWGTVPILHVWPRCFSPDEPLH